MSEEQIKDYLQRYEIKSEDGLANHILQLKTNTFPNIKLISELVWVLEDKESVFYSFLAENKNKTDYSPTPSKEFYNAFKQTTSSPTFMDEVLEDKVTDCSWTMCGQAGCIRCYPKSTVTEVPNFNLIDVEQILPKHILDVLEEQEGKRPDTFSYRPNQEIGNNPPFRTVEGTERQGEFATMEEMFSKAGKKESQTVKKAPIFTFCKQMKNAVEKLALRSLYGHEKYEKGDDWSNFARVPNADFEYSNSQFRHALEIGGEETEEEHLTASAWNAISRLEIYLRNKVK